MLPVPLFLDSPPQPEPFPGIQVSKSRWSASPWVIQGPVPEPRSHPTECTNNNIHHLWRPQDQPSRAPGQVLCASSLSQDLGRPCEVGVLAPFFR